MGHQRIGKLPASREWKAVVAQIGGGADVAHIAAITARAAEQSLIKAGNDYVLQRAAWFLARIPLAAREENFPQALRALGLKVSEAPTLLDVCAAVTAHLDAMMRQQGRKSDFGEIAQTALVESLAAIAAPAMPGLSGLTAPAEDTRIALKGLSTVRQFGVLARDFFARLIRRILDYYLSRELPRHVGVSQRFHSVREHMAFEAALDQHCHETSLIVRDYSGGWLSKAAYEGEIDEKRAGDFARYAFHKITSELEIRRGEPAHA